MTVVVLLVLVLVLTLLGVAWSMRRHRQVVSWDEELDRAFGSGAQRRRPAHRAH